MVVLADGTRVWLNAVSSLRYPVTFGGGERRVELTGEAYFDVTKNAAAPFRVEVKRSSQEGYVVEVLGTAFDINAYSDEDQSSVTLLGGAVRVTQPSGPDQSLSPGDQAKIAPGQPIRVIPNADIEAAVAWKNGYFLFHSTDLATILRQAARWYDVEVDVQRRVPTRFNGDVPRKTPVSDLLKAIELSGDVKFAIEGKKITVLK
jgi:ferric-dicitrate binding protein FerR (iron transport regulator)